MRLRVPELFLGCFLSVAIFSMGILFSSQYPSQTTQTERSEKRAEEKIQSQRDEGLWNWISHDAAGFFTFWLVIVGGGQLVLFYVQLKLIGESLIDAKTAANAAKESADAAKQSADHIPRVERAYLFLGLDYKATFKDFVLGYAGDTSKHSIMEFGFKNHGRTPALIEGLHAMAAYWAGPKWPSMSLAEGVVIQQGFAISAGEVVKDYTVEFPLYEAQLSKAESGSGFVLFWGKIIYRDVFGDLHETGWCRGYQREKDGWRFAGDETLNYYT